jgi:hypothetical protein
VALPDIALSDASDCMAHAAIKYLILGIILLAAAHLAFAIGRCDVAQPLILTVQVEAAAL